MTTARVRADSSAPTILTPDRRVRVFLSSTMEELAPERKAARRAIRRLHLTPVWFESGARPHPPRDMYQAYLAQSDVFVGIYWQRYGWVAPGMDVSGLEDEYRSSGGMPKLIYLKKPAPDQEPAMRDFLNRVRATAGVSYRSFGTPAELERLLTEDLALLLSESFAAAVRRDAQPVAAPPEVPPAGQPVGNLPRPLTSFVGRKGEVRRLAAAVRRERLVTLVGVGGVGKTRLALEAAHLLAREEPDGAWLCELQSSTDAESVVQAVAVTLVVPPRPGARTEDAVVAFLADRRLLLVLDNCEQVVLPAAELAEHVLRACPGVRILATSREALAIEGEHVWPVRPLGTPAASAGTTAVGASDAVRLFVDRARAVAPEFAVEEGNADALAEIARRLDGLPLAIELAAARAAVMPPTEIAGLLDERFRLLSHGRRTATERQQTLRATVDWSYERLAEPERRLFDVAGVFAGPFSVRALAAVAEDDEWAVHENVATLFAKSMLVREEGGPRARYRLLETLRQYAVERLVDAGSWEPLRRRHAQVFADFAQDAGRALVGPDELAWRPRLRANRENLRAAVTWSLAQPDPADRLLGVRIAAALAPYALHEAAGLIADWVERAVPAAEDAPPAMRAAVLGAAAFSAFQNRGDIEAAERLARSALRDGMDPDCPSPSSAYATLIMAQAITGRLDEAVASWRHAQRVVDGTGRDYHRALMLQTGAAITAMAGDVVGARHCAEEALVRARRVNNPSELAAALWTMLLGLERAEPEGALELADECIALIRSGASTAVLGHVLAIRASLRARGDQVGEALDDLRESAASSIDKGDRVALTVALDRAVGVLGAVPSWPDVATLAGAATRGPLAAVSTFPAVEREDRERVIAQARAELGGTRFAELERAGAALTPEQVGAELIALVDRARAVRR